MDPNANLREQLELARADWGVSEFDKLEPFNVDRLHTEHLRLQELVLALDEWIRKGGFLPAAWQR
jgi:hypothetical protein